MKLDYTRIMKYLVLLRGINVGGKNKVAMAELRQLLGDAGFINVSSYINSGNVILESTKSAATIRQEVQKILSKHFALDRDILNILVLTAHQVKQVFQQAPKDFGSQPSMYYSDAIFLMDITPKRAFAVFKPRDGVDAVWQGELVIYSQRLGAERTKSRLGKIVGTPEYESMTIRSWQTVKKLADLMRS